jgi:hypothetical protein
VLAAVAPRSGKCTDRFRVVREVQEKLLQPELRHLSRPSRQEAASATLADCHKNAGRDPCKVMTAVGSGCGALGFFTGSVRRTTYWGAFPAIKPTLGQAVDQALTWCRQRAQRPEACGIRLTSCCVPGAGHAARLPR